MNQNPDCCDRAQTWIKWRISHPMNGPEHEGWCIIIHVSTGSPEFLNIDFCPFCGQFFKQKPEIPV